LPHSNVPPPSPLPNLLTRSQRGASIPAPSRRGGEPSTCRIMMVHPREACPDSCSEHGAVGSSDRPLYSCRRPTPGQPNVPRTRQTRLAACRRLKEISPPSPKRSARTRDVRPRAQQWPIGTRTRSHRTAFRPGAEIIARLNDRPVVSPARPARTIAASALVIGAKSV